MQRIILFFMTSFVYINTIGSIVPSKHKRFEVTDSPSNADILLIRGKFLLLDDDGGYSTNISHNAENNDNIDKHHSVVEKHGRFGEANKDTKNYEEDFEENNNKIDNRWENINNLYVSQKAARASKRDDDDDDDDDNNYSHGAEDNYIGVNQRYLNTDIYLLTRLRWWGRW